jgi:CheY-like chemotaxis protein
MGVASEQERSAALRVLVAEDNLLNQRVLAYILRGIDCEVDMVETGVAAVAAFTHQRYDIVLMDVRMPEMDGMEATRQIRRLLPADAQPHIFALTAGIAPDERQECIAAGMELFLAKPVQREQLAEIFAQVAAERRVK